MNFTLHVWRQKNAHAKGQMTTYPAPDMSPDMSFLEMLDVVNLRIMFGVHGPAEGSIAMSVAPAPTHPWLSVISSGRLSDKRREPTSGRRSVLLRGASARHPG